MSADALESLNRKFGFPNTLCFVSGEGGLPFILIRTPTATAEICLHGAQLTAFHPASEEQPVIWLSPTAVWDSSKAIRGGIPVCWPWFGDHPSDPEKPAHGFARTSLWEVIATSQPESDIIRVELNLPADAAPTELFAPAFELTLVITVADTLSLELTTTNRSPDPFEITEALHTYLNVGAIETVRCVGLNGIGYRDKMDGFQSKRQSGDILFDSPVDRVYEGTSAEVLVHDPAFDRKIRVSKSGSDTTVIWNPWISGAARFGDMPEKGYRTMVCVEAANAGADSLTLQPGEIHSLSTTIGVEAP
ncbi:MAG: D-hexose-6-phosphate mutarotase [Verrucomicrobiae bacterium]|nr:D-hexose-6-phosphate mutarotase [Verrucomicrobiae bacterium]